MADLAPVQVAAQGETFDGQPPLKPKSPRRIRQ